MRPMIVARVMGDDAQERKPPGMCSVIGRRNPNSNSDQTIMSEPSVVKTISACGSR